MLFEQGITPSIVSKGNKILKLRVDEYDISFLDSYRYIKSSLAKCCKMYQLDMRKGFFPVRANRPLFYNACKIFFCSRHNPTPPLSPTFSASIPAFNWFVNENDSHQAVEEKRKWYLERKSSSWIFDKELALYCIDDSLIVTKLALKFSKEWIKIQEGMNRFFTPDKDAYFFPFSEFCTLSSFCFAMYKYFEGNGHTIKVIEDERGFTRVKVSYLEKKWVEKEYRDRNFSKNFKSQATHSKAPRIGRYVPDFVVYGNGGTIEEVGRVEKESWLG